MNSEEVHLVLKHITEKLEGRNITWRLEGSCNLLVQGIPITPNDLDIVTNITSLKEITLALKEYLIKSQYKEKIKAFSVSFRIKNAEVEVLVYEEKDKEMLDKINEISWKGITIPILPLEESKKFYKMIGKEDKMSLIEKYLSE